MTNVPMAAWIDEQGRIVRPAEPAGASDGFRTMDRTTFQMNPEIAVQGRATRQSYVEAVRDWVRNGGSSPYALTPAEIQARTSAPDTHEAEATAHFRLGQYLLAQGLKDDAQPYFDAARRLCPESWHFVRQALELVAVGNASGPEFFASVDALGARPYYPPVKLAGTGG
jgi:hypothetical protein